MTKKMTDGQVEALLGQIELIWKRFQNISSEARVILDPGNMPQAELQLKDVLKTTEEATVLILQQVTEIGSVVDQPGVSDAVKSEVQARIAAVYEACSFQDLTGQRIKKVLTQIGEIGQHLKRLSDVANLRDDTPIVREKDPLLNGPQLNKDMPNQASIDNMFEKC